MSKNTFIAPTFNCHLLCDQCTATNKAGRQCGNRVCFGLPYCWIHTKSIYGLRIKTSTIPGAGKGLFTVKYIPKGFYISPYGGEIITDNCLEQRYPGNAVAPYSVTARNTLIIDSACQRGIASTANGLFKRDGTSQRKALHNVILDDREDDNGNVWLLSTKRIRPDSEIFLWYGDTYTLENDHTTRRVRRDDNRPC